MYFRVRIKGGHCGAGRYNQRVLYIEADSIYRAMEKAVAFPSIKHNAKNVEKVEPISRSQYMRKMYWINQKKNGKVI